MIKKVTFIILAMLFVGCSDTSSKALFSEDELKQLKEAGINSEIKECAYPKSLMKMIDHDLNSEYVNEYCELKSISSPQAINALLVKGVKGKELKEYAEVKYLRVANVERYLNYKDQSLTKKELVKQVNLNLDQKPYEHITEIEDTNDITMLINKFSKLPDGYVPSDVMDTPAICTCQYSCFPNQQYVVKEAGEHYQSLVDAANGEGIKIVAIASLRDYNYQKTLYNYYLNSEGLEYADQYFARPGQSEHNSGLAIDITMDDMDYTQIENHPKYQWLLDNIADYGFILRYPKDKEDVTGFSHESWHLRYVGKDLAIELNKKRLTLDEYKAMQGD